MTLRTALSLTLLALAFPATAGASITEFTGLTKGVPSGGITAGPHDAVWFTIQGTPGGIGHIHADGSITEYAAGVVPGFTSDSEPEDIVTGPDGALWFTEQGGTGAIGRLDPDAETVTEYTDGLSPNSEPAGITAGPDGNLWFTETAKGAIGRITPDGTITEFTSGISGSSEPTDIAAGPDGNLWFTEAGDPGAIGRIDPETGEITEFRDGLAPDGAPAAITAASNGKLYFTQPAGSRISRIKTDGRIEAVDAGLAPGARPTGIAEGGDGALWLTTAAAPGPLGRLWPDAGALQQLTGGLTAILEPGGIAQGPDGNIWYTLAGLPGIGRVTVPPHAAIDMPVATEDGRFELKGSVRANSQGTTYHFEYGAGGGDLQTPSAEAGDDAERKPVGAAVDLQRDTSYRARLVAVNASGTAVSADKSFYVTVDGGIVREKIQDDGTSTVVTEPPASPLEPPVVAALPPAAPVLGQSVNVAPVTGTIRVKAPGADHFAPLAAGASIQVGSLVDAREGRVELRTALREGKTQTGTFWGSIFQVRQRRYGRGMTDLLLRGGRFSRCPATGGSRRARAAGVTRDVGRRRVVRRLWGKDRHARFRTHGRDSVATVRGTIWSTVDRCDGTLTRVKEGKVLVRDVRRKRSVLLTAGRSYLARHRR